MLSKSNDVSSKINSFIYTLFLMWVDYEYRIIYQCTNISGIITDANVKGVVVSKEKTLMSQQSILCHITVA